MGLVKGGMEVPRMIGIYVSDESEWVAVKSIFEELTLLGIPVMRLNDLDSPADIGLYACHSNLHFDFEKGQWKKPRNRISIGILHDLFQDNGQGEAYFKNDSWHIYDLGIIPGPRWETIASRAELVGIPSPKYGFRTLGWPKLDSLRAEEREGRGGGKKKILVAASWQGFLQVADILKFVDFESYDVQFKFQTTSAEKLINSPWKPMLVAHGVESHAAEQYAIGFNQIDVADNAADIFSLIADADLVISNGSNVGFEAILAGKPAITVLDWPHPSGPFGEDLSLGHSDFPGLYPSLARDLNTTIEAVLENPQLSVEVNLGSKQLVSRNTRFQSTRLVTRFLERLYSDLEVLTPPIAKELGFMREGYPMSGKAELQAQIHLLSQNPAAQEG